MSYVSLLLIIIITILIIVIAILFTVATDNLARIPDPTDSLSSRVLDNVISIGSFVVIFLIFLIALGLTIIVLIYYNLQRGTISNLAFFLTITMIIAFIGLLILEIHLYSEINIFRREVNDIIVTQSINYILWGIILTVVSLILCFILALTF